MPKLNKNSTSSSHDFSRPAHLNGQSPALEVVDPTLQTGHKIGRPTAAPPALPPHTPPHRTWSCNHSCNLLPQRRTQDIAPAFPQLTHRRLRLGARHRTFQAPFSPTWFCPSPRTSFQHTVALEDDIGQTHQQFTWPSRSHLQLLRTVDLSMPSCPSGIFGSHPERFFAQSWRDFRWC